AFEILAEKCTSPLPEVAGIDVYRNLLVGQVSDLPRDDLRIHPLGIVSLSDTVRTDVRPVLDRFSQTGIQFKILSGDSAVSIRATCRDIGWDVPPSDVITGAELDARDGAEFEKAVERAVVFARLKPEHKLKIISALRARGLHTAMIGDGVNDVPAIKQADLGIAMEEGASITREVADIVLRQNRFTLLPEVFEEGNRIVNSVGAVAKLFLTKNFLVIYLTLATALLALEFPLTPRRVSLFNVFAIGLPAMTIAFTNRNSTRVRRFFADLISFVALSALITAAFGYLALAAAGSGGGETAAMIMVSVMVLASVANFLVVSLGPGHQQAARYVGMAIAMILVYGIGLSLTGDGWLLRLVHEYYEITPLDGAAWTRVAEYGASAGAVLAVAQWVRAAFLRSDRSRS
ncbi:MAG TPA: HAD-IC family P-type ATPase, partial [Verrucomicrobiae bacterium]|nr:HAD-IC family P-type ATPase [Verrucomicrobiae bacterium]